jgi:hypothetical protein
MSQKLKSITIDGQKFEIDAGAPTTKYLKITNPTWVYVSVNESFTFSLTEQQCLENDIIEIFNDEVPAGEDTSNLYYIEVPNVKKPLRINFVGNVQNNILGFKGTIDTFFPRGLQDAPGAYPWNGASMLLTETNFYAYTTELSPQFIQYKNSGYDIILKVLNSSEI